MHPNTLHIVVDIETTGAQPGCRILSIGAVALNSNTYTQEYIFEIFLDPEDTRFTVDDKTMEWWKKQSIKAQKSNFCNGKMVPCEVGLQKFNSWIQDIIQEGQERRFWSKGSNFDFPILEYAYQKTLVKVPWNYWEILDLRTLLNVHKNISLSKRGNTPHIALNDAIHEAHQLATILRCLC